MTSSEPRRYSRRRKWLIAGATATVLVTTVLLVFEPWKGLVNVTVTEAPPLPIETGPPPTGPPSPRIGEPIPTATLGPEYRTTARVLARGQFVNHEHATQGTVLLLELPNRRHVLRLESLNSTNGPELRVWLTDSKVIPGTAGWRVFDDGKHVDLGELKGNRGNQNYEVPREVVLYQYRSVSIWCARFRVSFGAATLDFVK